MARTETDWGGGRAPGGCSLALAALTVAVAVAVGVYGGLYDLHVLHWYVSAAALLPAWTARPLTLLLPALPAPVTPEEREHAVHLRIEGTDTGTWFNGSQLRDHIEHCRVLLGELTARAMLVAERLPADPVAEQRRIDAEWSAAAEARQTSTYPPEPAESLSVTAEDADAVLRAAGFPVDADDQQNGAERP
jgi:hypothetical protein